MRFGEHAINVKSKAANDYEKHNRRKNRKNERGNSPFRVRQSFFLRRWGLTGGHCCDVGLRFAHYTVNGMKMDFASLVPANHFAQKIAALLTFPLLSNAIENCQNI